MALKHLLHELEECRSTGGEAGVVLALQQVRTIEVPLDLVSCRELRVLAHVFSGDQPALAALVLKAALLDMQEHLDDDLDSLADIARKLMEDPCQKASEVI
ncbi:hypothetical protein [uncultured Aquitalea sp.]|uniref:hypothetical protein n=1 Tax=uncultured Aquitalea sp. TaxID=540272 RepID=UPI0025CCBA96|nr:hypothetical protein [uncultured Aquitalea sp.]